MRALKLLVIGLGVLLLAGIGALAAAVMWRINHGRLTVATKSTPVVQRIALPAGAQVVATDVAGDRLVARVNLPDGGIRVFVFDLATGSDVTTIELAPASP